LLACSIRDDPETVMSLRTWVLAAAAAGVTASLYARSRHHNAARPLLGEPGEADELLGSQPEQEQPGEWSSRNDPDTWSGLSA
jgi:hypothetical protein